MEVEERVPWQLSEESCQGCRSSLDGELESGEWNGWKGWYRWRPKHGTWRRWHLSKDGETTACGYEIKRPELEIETRSASPGEHAACGRCQRTNGQKDRGSANLTEALWNAAELAFDLLVG